MARKVDVNIEIDGKSISPIAYLAINQPLNGHHTFELRCPLQEREQSLNQGSDACGKEVKIEIASGGGRSGAKNAFKGFVTGVSLTKHQGAPNELVYHGCGPSLLMDDGAHNESFTEKTLDKIVKTIAGKYNISISPSSNFKSAIPYVVQYRETGFNFLSRLANQYGEWFYYDGTEFVFGKAPSGTPVNLIFGRDLFSFDLALNLSPAKFRWMGYDHVSHSFPESAAGSAKVSGLDEYGKKLTGAADSLFDNEPAVSVYHEIQDKSGLDEVVKHQRAARAGGFVVFTGTSDNHGLKVGSIINVKGSVGDAASAGRDVGYGEFRILKISHSTDALGNYQNHFKAIPSSLVEPPANPNFVQPVCELQIAEVLENHDPEDLGRVRVQFPWQKASGEKTPWIRLTASGAGDSHGHYFVPEKNDQVFVGFEHNNPDRPYVVGGLYHGKAKPKGVSDKDNNKKVIQTKSGNMIAFNDDPSGTSITIENGKNSISLSMSGSGSIAISTKGDLSLNGKNITITASEKLSMSGKESSIEGKSKLSASSPETTVEGKMSAKFSGKMVEVSADAVTDIKGGTIKLN